ncbi:MAG: cytochrome P450 [Acidimicrobiia bacterium]
MTSEPVSEHLAPGDLNIADREAMAEFGIPPDRYFAVLRRTSPVHWNPPPPLPDTGQVFVTKGFWILSKYADVDMASKDWARFSAWEGGVLWLDPENVDFTSVENLRAGLMGMDPPDHTMFRRLLQPGFTPRRVAELEPAMRVQAQRIVTDLARRGSAEFVFDAAAQLPMFLLCELMGIPEKDRPQYVEQAVDAAKLDDPDVDQRSVNSALFRYCRDLVARKRERPDDTMISKYANGTIDGRRLTDMEIAEFFVTLSIAGHETARNTTAHFVRLMSEHPGQKQLLLEDLDARLPNAIEEVLRFSPPVMHFRRTATTQIELRGNVIAKGDKVLLSYVSANRDDEVFEDGDRFDILRANANAHLAFGAGPHYCLGAALARMQLRCILGEVYRVLPELEVSDAPTWMRSVWLNGLSAMPVRTGA